MPQRISTSVPPSSKSGADTTHTTNMYPNSIAVIIAIVALFPPNTSQVRIANCFGKSVPSSPYCRIFPPPSWWWYTTLLLFILLRVLMTLVRSDVISPHKTLGIPTIRYAYYDWLKILMDFSFHFSLWPQLTKLILGVISEVLHEDINYLFHFIFTPLSSCSSNLVQGKISLTEDFKYILGLSCRWGNYILKKNEDI